MNNKKGQEEVFAYVLVLTTIIILFLMVVSMIFYTGISQTKSSFGSVRLSPPLTDEISKETEKPITLNTYFTISLIRDFHKLFIVLMILALVLLIKRIINLNKKKSKK